MNYQARLNDAQVSRTVHELKRSYNQHLARLAVRRLLVEMGTDATQSNDTGVNVPKPFDKSSLIIQTLTGDVVQTVQHYSSRFKANPPIPYVVQTPLHKRDITNRMRDAAADEENLLKSMWESCNGRQLQAQIGWSQAWGRVGWYFTLPRAAAWGIPDRTYFEELTDEELEDLRKDGKLTEVDDGKYAESADAWFERIHDNARERAINGESMFILRAYAPDMVLAQYDDDGNVKAAAAVMEMSAADCEPGSAMMMAAGKYAGVEDPGKYGLYVDNGKVTGSINQGGEPGSRKGDKFTLTIYADDTEVYYLVGAGTGTSGKIIWAANHYGGMCPFIPAPAYRTDSRKPGAEYSSPCEPVFAISPPLNQAMTLLSNVAAFNAIPRWVIEDENGNLIPDPETGQPKMVDKDAYTPGLDPSQATVVGGRIKQLEISAPVLTQLLEFYTNQMDKARPSPIMSGSAGTSGPAWNIRQQIEQINETLSEPAENHAAAVRTVFRLWIRWMRLLDRPVIYALAPGLRKNKTNTRALIEMNPEDLTENIVVAQDSQSASDRIVLQQMGIELLEKGLIDEDTYLERYALEEDPEDMKLRLDLSRIEKAVMYGDNNQIQPGSVMADVVEAVRGRLTYELLNKSPNFAIASAEAMTAEAQMAAMQQLPGGGVAANPVAPTGGNIAETAGVRTPGLGMPGTLEGMNAF